MRMVVGSLTAICGLVVLGPVWGAPDAAPVERPSVLGSGDFIVGSDRGLEIWNVDGTVKRSITHSPAPHPRWLNDTTLLVVEGVDLHGEAGEPVIVSKIDLPTGKTTVVARARPIACAKEASEFEVPGVVLGLGQERDFSVDQSGKAACLRLADGPESMVVFMAADLATGKTRQTLQEAPHGCQLPSGVKIQPLDDRNDCHGSSHASGPNPVKANALDFAFKGHSLFKNSVDSKRGLVIARLPTYDEEALASPSPSTRWQVLSGDIQSQDFVYRKLVLVDRRSGDIFSPPAKPGKWPRPLQPGTRKIVHVADQTLTVSGESDVRWLGFDDATEALVVDQLIIRPGFRMFSVQGIVAR